MMASRSDAQRNGERDSTINKGLAEAAARAAEPTDQLRLVLTSSQQKRLAALCDALGLSFKTVALAAVKLTLFHLRGLDAAQRKRFIARRPARSGAVLVVELTLETLDRMRQVNIEMDQLPRCALAGIDLMHQRLLSSENEVH